MVRERSRKGWRTGAVGLVLAGMACAVLGVSVARAGPDPEPLPVTVAEPLRVPRPRAFEGPVALYGVPPSARIPPADEFGCALSGGPPGPVGGPADALDRLVIGDRAVLPLLRLPADAPGRTLTCLGPAAATSEPVYLVRSPGVRALVPMGAWSLAALALVLGLGGVVRLHPPDEARWW